MWSSRHIAALAVLAGVLVVGMPDARAQGFQDGSQLLVSGDKALRSGDYRVAVRSYSRAINSDRLEDGQVPLVLARRGEAHRRSGSPAKAIADLSGALWLDGLSSAARARAYLNRGLAYQAVGMNDRARADLGRARQINPKISEDTPLTVANWQRERQTAATQVAGQGPAAEPAQAPAQPPRQSAPASGVSVAGRATPRETPQETTAAPRSEAPRQAQAPRREQPEATPQFRTTIVPGEAQKQTPPQTSAPAPAAPAPFQGWATSVAPKSPGTSADTEETGASKKSKGRIGRFFSGLWSSSDDKKKPDDASGPGSAPLASGQRTRTATAEKPTRTAPAASASAQGQYRIQLAAVRTETEAQATWKRLAEQHRSLLDGREPTIEKTELGTLGTFYRLQIGPFADKRETLRLCNAFKRSGVDCFLVTR